MNLLARAARGLRAALEPLPVSSESGPLPKLVLRRTGLDTDAARAERTEAAMALHDEETISYVMLVIREDSQTLDIHAQVPDILRRPMLDGLAALYAGMVGK